MLAKLLLIFISIPLVEILILIKMGEVMGFWATVLLVIGTGAAGAALARWQGMRTWLDIQMELRGGRVPGEKMIDALLLLAAGLLLITPGLLTDIAGFLLLLPWSRFYFKRWLRKKFDEMLRESGRGDFQFFIR
jgi:UPF0716 protein FxsA